MTKVVYHPHLKLADFFSRHAGPPFGLLKPNITSNGKITFDPSFMIRGY
jgi:hypothetical protein